MATLLLLVIYIAFIGLGLPDSLFGAAWPAIYAEYGLPFSFGSFVTVLSFFGTTISSVCSAKVIRRFGTNKVTAFSTALTAAALLCMSFTGSYLPMCLFALPLGLGAGAMFSALFLRDRYFRQPVYSVSGFKRRSGVARRLPDCRGDSGGYCDCAVLFPSAMEKSTRKISERSYPLPSSGHRWR